MQLFSTIDSRRPFPPSVLLYKVVKNSLFRHTSLVHSHLLGRPHFFTKNERVKTFSDRGQKLFYSRSEIFLFAVRKHSVRGQKNLPTKRNRQTSLPIPYPRPTKNSGNTHHKSVRRYYIFLSDNKPFTSHEAH